MLDNNLSYRLIYFTSCWCCYDTCCVCFCLLSTALQDRTDHIASTLHLLRPATELSSGNREEYADNKHICCAIKETIQNLGQQHGRLQTRQPFVPPFFKLEETPKHINWSSWVCSFAVLLLCLVKCGLHTSGGSRGGVSIFWMSCWTYASRGKWQHGCFYYSISNGLFFSYLASVDKVPDRIIKGDINTLKAFNLSWLTYSLF